MMCHRCSIGVLLLLLTASALPAQFVPGPFGPVQVGPVPVLVAPGLSLNYLKVKKNSAFALSLNRGYGSYGPLYGPFPPGYSSTRFTQIIVQPTPIFVTGPPLVPGFLPPLQPLPPEEELPPPPPPLEEPALPGRDAGIFKPLDADNRDRARRPVPAAPPDKPKDPPPLPPQERPMKRLDPDPDPRVEGARRLELGKEAFERGEYGRAAERFRQAADLAPTSAFAQFLLGQTHLALGNYRRAFDALQTGLRLDPDWPRQPFRPIELYGDNVVDHADHTQLLEDLLAATPNDPVMLFLTGYQLWFDGRRDEAKLLLQRAAPSLPDPTLLDRFLQALPPSDVL